MWIFKNDAFVSLVQDRDVEGVLWARARVAGHLEAFFRNADFEVEVIETPAADYRYRCAVDRSDVASILCKAAEDVTYDNFKKSIDKTPKGNRYHDALLDVWRAMFGLQRKELDCAAAAARRSIGERVTQRRKRGKKKGPKA